MASPVGSKAPHWLLYTMQFKDPAKERAKVVYAGKPALYNDERVISQFNYDVPKLFGLSILQSNTARKVVAVLLWAVGGIILTAIAMIATGARKKTRNFAASYAAQNTSSQTIAQSRAQKVAQDNFTSVNAHLGITATPAPGHKVHISNTKTFLDDLSRKQPNAITISDLENLGDLAAEAFIKKNASAIQAINSSPFKSDAVLGNIARRVHELANTTGLTPVQKSRYAKIVSKLLYTCEALQELPHYNPVTDGALVTTLQNSLSRSLNSLSVGLQSGHINYAPGNVNQRTFSIPGLCAPGNANSACGSMALATLLRAHDPLTTGFRIHSALKTAAGEPLSDYTSPGQINSIPGITVGAPISETHAELQHSLVERYNIMLSRIGKGQEGLLQVGTLYLMCRKNPDGSVDIYDSHGSGTANQGVANPGSAAYFAHFTDRDAAATFLAANRRPSFQHAAYSAMAFHPITVGNDPTTGIRLTADQVMGGLPHLPALPPGPVIPPRPAGRPPLVAQPVGPGHGSARIIRPAPHGAAADDDDDDGVFHMEL